MVATWVIYDFGEEDDQPFIIMRYMTGGSLADRLRRDGALSLAEASHIFNPLTSALDRAHAKNIVHRDLKPANVMFDADGEPYISDFGIAKIVEAGPGFTGSVIVGTPTYMSPEQWKGEKNIDGRSDVYALGALLFEMLTGKLPFDVDTPAQMMYKHLTEPPLSILQLSPNLPARCEDIIRKAMAKDRAERYTTAGELASELKQLVAQESDNGVRKAAEKREAERIAKEKAEQERLAREKLEAAHVVKEKAVSILTSTDRLRLGKLIA